MSKIKIIDSIMGSGKTTYAINKMNQDKENNYIYITPFLDEVKRIKENCESRKFYEPTNIGNGKLDSLHNLLQEGKNIASTHALFRMSNDITKELINANNYILILDEVCDVIEQVQLKKNDLEVILKFSHIDEDNRLLWDDEEYDGRFNDVKTMAYNSSLMLINNCLLMWNFPVGIFQAFKECYIMTYLFDAQIQKYYYDLHEVEYEYIKIDKYNKVNKEDIRSRITILEDDVINNIGEYEYALSVSWFNKDNKNLTNKLKNNLFNYFKNKMKAKSEFIMWTTFKKYKKKLSGAGYTKGFVSCNARATNNYRDKNCLAYCVNIFLNPIVKNFFENKGVNVLEDKYALSELLQWVWRSAIRDGEKIQIYIPSQRMRNLFSEWLKSQTF